MLAAARRAPRAGTSGRRVAPPHPEWQRPGLVCSAQGSLGLSQVFQRGTSEWVELRWQERAGGQSGCCRQSGCGPQRHLCKDRADTCIKTKTELRPIMSPKRCPQHFTHRKRSRVACGEAVKACGETGGQTAAPEPRGLPSPEPQGPRSHWPRVGSRGGRGEAGPAAQPCVSPHDATRRPGPVPGDTALERIYLLKWVMCYRSLGNIRGILLLIRTSPDGSLTTCFLGCCLSVVDL